MLILSFEYPPLNRFVQNGDFCDECFTVWIVIIQTRSTRQRLNREKDFNSLNVTKWIMFIQERAFISKSAKKKSENQIYRFLNSGDTNFHNFEKEDLM